MKEYNIRTSPVSFLVILELETETEINSHGHLTITGYIDDEEEENILDLLKGDLWEKIEEVSRDGETQPLFWGIVTDYRLETVNDQKKLTLEALTGSSLMDNRTHLRSFQNQDMTYEEIFRKVTSGYGDGRGRYHSSLGKQTGGLVLQYHETDWEFLKRLAARHHRFLLSEPGVKGTGFAYDHPAGEEFSFSAEQKYAVRKELSRCRQNREEGLAEAAEADCLIYTIYRRERQDIGDYAVIQGRKYHIFRIRGSYRGGEMLYACELKSSRGMSVPETLQPDMTGASLDAAVLEVREDKVRIRLINDENGGQDPNIWYTYATVYSTPDGTGWYMMPEPGDTVRLNVPGRDERRAFVTSSVHMETDSPDRKNPDHKVLKSKYQKEIRFTPDTIVITNNQGTRIELTDAEGINLVSSHSVMLESAGDMTLSSDSGSLLLAGTQAVNIKQRGTAVNLTDGVVFTGGSMKVQ